MESAFYKVRAIRIGGVKNLECVGSWIQIIVTDNVGGEHEINCFPERGETIPISLHPGGEDDA